MTAPPERAVAVVLAGGTSRRFGRDKLAARAGAGAGTLLDGVLSTLPGAVGVVVVGPERPTVRPVRFVREEPPGGGPAAALLAGLRAALAEGADYLAVLPADAPRAGHAAGLLLARLGDRPSVTAVVATDAEGREQPLQLALRPAAARRLITAAADGGHGAAARALLRALDPPAEPVVLAAEDLFDIDTPAQLATWRARSSPAVEVLLGLIAAAHARTGGSRPVVVAVAQEGADPTVLAQVLRLRGGPAAVVVAEGTGGEPADVTVAVRTRDAAEERLVAGSPPGEVDLVLDLPEIEHADEM